MNSNELIFNALDISTSSLLFNDKETQTSIVHLINIVPSIKCSSRPVPRNIDTSGKEINYVKKLELSQDLQNLDDTDSITIKETFTEEVLPNSDSTFFTTPSPNKFIDYKEIIQKPYNITYPNDCNLSIKESIQHQITPTEEINIITIKEIRSKTMDCNKNKATFVNPNTLLCDECKKKKEENVSSCSSSSMKNTKLPCEPQKPQEQECKKVDECKLKSCISNCISESLKVEKKDSAACNAKSEKVIGVKQPENCNEKPSHCSMNKPKSKEPSSTELHPKRSLESLLEAQSKVIDTIKCAIKDFAGTVYNKTKDCVNLIKTESCKYLPNCENSTPVKDCKSQSKTKDCSNTPSATSTLFERIKGQTSKTEENPEKNNINALIEPAKEVMEHVASTVVSTVESTISIIKNSNYEQIADDIINSKFNKSSPYDEPEVTKTPPIPVSQEQESSSNTMFALIKTKLLSLFIDQKTGGNTEDSEDE